MAISAEAMWNTYVQHFSFTQLGWIFDSYNSKAEEDMIHSPDIVKEIISDWLEHQWPGVLAMRVCDSSLLAEILASKPMPMNFVNFIDVLKQYETLHIESEDNAGFPFEQLRLLEDIFDSHRTGSSCGGLKGKALFGVLEDLDIQFHSKDERQWYVDTVKRLDKNGDGSIDFVELCQIIRTVVDMELLKRRIREFNLIKQSKLPFDEVEDWNVLFQTKDEEGQGELQLLEVKDLITSIGVQWDREFSATIQSWLLEADENNNGTIDFGEFCLLIGKLWSSNLRDIRGASRTFLQKDVVVSLRSVHNVFITANSAGEMTCTNSKVGSDETFTMIRQPNGNVTFKGNNDCYVKCIDEKVLCTEKTAGTQFKVNTLEDERIIFTAATQFGGSLFADASGVVAVSDGNPNDEPNFPFTVLKQEELEKKCWSRLLPKRRPSKMLVEGRQKAQQSKEVPKSRLEPLSPGIRDGIEDMERALEDNRSRSNSKMIAVA